MGSLRFSASGAFRSPEPTRFAHGVRGDADELAAGNSRPLTQVTPPELAGCQCRRSVPGLERG